MNNKELVVDLWNDMDKQNLDNLYLYFTNDAVINWHNTNESFDVEEFIRVNREYPGDWNIKIERLESIENLVISVVKAQLKNEDTSVHAVSFFEFHDGKIKLLNEYWGDDGKVPQWRIDTKLGNRLTV